MRTRLLMALAALGAGFAFIAPAAAQSPSVYNVCVGPGNGNLDSTWSRSCTSVATYNGGTTSIINGQVDTPNSSNGMGGSYTTATSDGGWTNSALGTSTYGATASGSASLADGTVHAYVANNGAPGSVLSNISDIVTFNNSSGSAVLLNIGYTFDGVFSGPTNGWANGYANLTLSSTNGLVHLAGSGNSLSGGGFYSGVYSTFDISGAFSQLCTLAAQDCVAIGGTNVGGVVNGGYSTGILIPTGESQLGFSLALGLDCRLTNGSCDFGHTSAFAFGALPTGLSYTSQSGTLFSALAPPTSGAVPEPATWAMMVIGFGMIGAATRRRPRQALRLA